MNSLLIVKGGRNRLLYLIIFLFLSITAIVSFDPSIDMNSSRIGGTIFTFALIVICFFVAFIVRNIEIDKVSNSVQKTIGLPFGLVKRTVKSYPLGSNARFVISSITYTFSTRQKSSLSKRKAIVRLNIETMEDSIIICESKMQSEVEEVGNFLSHYLGIPLVLGN